MPNSGPSTNNSLSSLTAKINAQAEAERQALESQVETEFKTLCVNLRTSAANAFATIENDIQKAAEITRRKTAVQIRLLNSGFMKRCLLYVLASLALLSIVAMAGAGMTILAKHYVSNLRQELDDLNQQKAALQGTIQKLQDKTWGLTLRQDKDGTKAIILPRGVTADTNWTVGKQQAIKLME